MPGRMSNRDRIAHLRAEADAAAKEKDAKKAAKAAEPKKARKSPAKKAAPSGKVRIVWAVCDQSGKVVQQFPYPQEKEARAEAEQRATATGRTHFVKQTDVAAD